MKCVRHQRRRHPAVVFARSHLDDAPVPSSLERLLRPADSRCVLHPDLAEVTIFRPFSESRPRLSGPKFGCVASSGAHALGRGGASSRAPGARLTEHTIHDERDRESSSLAMRRVRPSNAAIGTHRTTTSIRRRPRRASRAVAPSARISAHVEAFEDRGRRSSRRRAGNGATRRRPMRPKPIRPRPFTSDLLDARESPRASDRLPGAEAPGAAMPLAARRRGQDDRDAACSTSRCRASARRVLELPPPRCRARGEQEQSPPCGLAQSKQARAERERRDRGGPDARRATRRGAGRRARAPRSAPALGERAKRYPSGGCARPRRLSRNRPAPPSSLTVSVIAKLLEKVWIVIVRAKPASALERRRS